MFEIIRPILFIVLFSSMHVLFFLSLLSYM
jgi:hypothetical protein